MPETLDTDICVIGAGSAGLSVAAGASQMGAPTVLIERDKMGGDCLNVGCVPSKSLIAAAKMARLHRSAGAMGVHYEPPRIDFAAVHGHVHGVIAAIAPNDSVERFEGLGVTVIKETARFVGPQEVQAGDTRIKARRIVVATGSRPLVPPIPGIDEVPFLTNESLFDVTRLPARLIVVGGGPIGCELGQAFARVDIVEMASIMPKDDPELVEVVRRSLRADGVALHEQAKVTAVARAGEGVAVTIERDGKSERLEGSALLVAAGRSPNVEGLDLEAAGVDYDRRGIKVDRRLRTSNRKVYAAGDITGGYQFTHMAAHHAGIVIRNALFRLPAKVEDKAVPWVTFTDPELAHVGLNEHQARQKAGEIRVLRWAYAENDRAQTERRLDGQAKIVTDRRGKVLGASIVGANAGELIAPWVLAIQEGLKVGPLAKMIAPYPTLSEVGKRAAGSFYTPKLFSERTAKLVRFLAKFG